jgi:acetyl-CoA C-acetyltransferase
MAKLTATWDDVWLLDGMRTPFSDLGGPLSLVSATDLGIKAARAVLDHSGAPADDIGSVIAGNVAQTSFDAFCLPRHIGLYAGAPIEAPAHLVQRVCGTGMEILAQAADTLTLGRAELVLCVGTESMSRNPVAAYTHRNGFRLGQVEFKDFLWEALLDPAPDATMGHTAENLARSHQISREDVDAYAARSFNRALAAREDGYFDDEIVPVTSETFERDGFEPRDIRLSRKVGKVGADTHLRPSSVEGLAKIRPAFGGVQTGGNSSGIVDGAAAALVCTGGYAAKQKRKPLGRIAAWATVGVPPEIMGIGPVPAIRTVLESAGLELEDIDRFEINEAFAAQVLACGKELGFDEDRLNVNGGAIAIGHPLAASGVRLSVTVARELARSGGRWGIASACIGGGQGIAVLIENPDGA